MRDAARRVLLTLAPALALVIAATAAVSPPALAAGLPAAGASSNREAFSAQLGQPGGSGPAVAVSRMPGSGASAIGPLHELLQADLFVVDSVPLSPSLTAALRRLPGVTAAQQIDAARIQVAGKLTAMLGVDPAAFRAFAAKPTAQATGLWENVAAGGIAVSYTMGTMDKLPLGRVVKVDGRRTEELPLAGLGTVGIAGVDAVVSDTVARSLGIPAGNAIVISAPHASLSSLLREAGKLLPHGAQAAPLVAQAAPAAPGRGSTGAAGDGQVGAVGGPGLSIGQVRTFLRAAESRLGLPYVWGGSGPDVFDCSGLVQWSMAQAGIVMPRVAADQALAGPQVSVSQLQPGDLLFYHTDPTAPDYISHVAIYLGDGVMLQAPEPGLDVEAVPAAFGSEFAGAVRVYPRVAALVAADVAA